MGHGLPGTARRYGPIGHGPIALSAEPTAPQLRGFFVAMVLADGHLMGVCGWAWGRMASLARRPCIYFIDATMRW